MILFGTGALLKNALITAIDSASRVDYVVSHSEELKALCSKNHIPFKKSDNFNQGKTLIEKNVSDGVVFSINNGQIFNEEMLAIPGVKFYNIHNGLIPAYRGLPEVCIFFALLNGDSEYGVSLHEIDTGIDTGRCIEQYRFPIKDGDTFQEVMLNGIKSCHEIFAANLSRILSGNISYMTNESGHSKLYTYNTVLKCNGDINYSNLKQAKNFGIFKLYYPRFVSLVNDKFKEITI